MSEATYALINRSGFLERQLADGRVIRERFIAIRRLVEPAELEWSQSTAVLMRDDLTWRNSDTWQRDGDRYHELVFTRWQDIEVSNDLMALDVWQSLNEGVVVWRRGISALEINTESRHVVTVVFHGGAGSNLRVATQYKGLDIIELAVCPTDTSPEALKEIEEGIFLELGYAVAESGELTEQAVSQ